MADKKIVIIGGGAGGMTAAVRLRRLSNDCKITVVEKSPYVAWAGCPMPYYMGNKLQIKSVIHYRKEHFINNRNIMVLDNTQITSINPEEQFVIADSGDKKSRLDFDYLIISAGVKPRIMPPFERYIGKINGIFTFHHVKDMLAIEKYINSNYVRDIAIIGGGAIGLALSSNLAHVGYNVNVIEKMQNILPFLSNRMRAMITKEIPENINIITGHTISDISTEDGKINKAILDNGEEIDAQIIIMVSGVEADTSLFKDNNIHLDEYGHIIVNEYMQTNYNNIYAVGDNARQISAITGKPIRAYLGDVADKQGFIAATNIVRGNIVKFEGLYHTQISSFGDWNIARCGLTETEAKDFAGNDNIAVEGVKGFNRLAGFEGTTPTFIDVIYDKSKNNILGAMAVGKECVAQFIDIFSIAIKEKLTPEDIFNIDFAYSPKASTVWNPLLAWARKVL